MPKLFFQGRNDPLTVSLSVATKILNDKKARVGLDETMEFHGLEAIVDSTLNKITRIERDPVSSTRQDNSWRDDAEYMGYLRHLRGLSPHERAINEGVQSFLHIMFFAHNNKYPTADDVTEMTKRCQKFFVDNPKRTKPDYKCIVDDFKPSSIMRVAVSPIYETIRQDMFAARKL